MSDSPKIVNSHRPDRRPATGPIVVALAAYRPSVRYFAEQLASIRAQSYEDWRCIVTLDSPLAELQEAPELADAFADPRFAWHENAERLGFKRNFERAIGLACRDGAWAIATCDQDDVWMPEKLATLADELACRSPLALVHSDMLVLDGEELTDRRVWQRTRQGVDDASPADLLVANVVTGCSALFDADLARRYPEIPASFAYHDHWYALAASCHGGVHPVREPLVAYRQHGDNVVGATEFEWGVSVPGARGLGGELAALRERWRTLRARTADALAAGMPLPRGLVLRYRNGADLGVTMLGRGLVRTFSNPRLSRYLIRSAIGRVLDLLPS